MPLKISVNPRRCRSCELTPSMGRGTHSWLERQPAPEVNLKIATSKLHADPGIPRKSSVIQTYTTSSNIRLRQYLHIRSANEEMSLARSKLWPPVKIVVFWWMILSLYQCQKKQGESGWRTDQIVATKINRSAFLAWYALSKFRPILQQPDHHKGTLIMTTRVEKERFNKGKMDSKKNAIVAILIALMMTLLLWYILNSQIYHIWKKG